MKSKLRSQKWGHKDTRYPLIWFPITHTWLKWSSRTLGSHDFFFLYELGFPPSFVHLLPLLKENAMQVFFFHETHIVSSSCREECVLVARTLHFSPSQPSTHAQALWHGLYLWRKTNINQMNKHWITHNYSYCLCFTLKRFTVTSFQSLHCTLTASVCGPDLLSKLFYDGQQLCIFVLRHLATGRALKLEQTQQDEPGSTNFTVSFFGMQRTVLCRNCHRRFSRIIHFNSSPVITSTQIWTHRLWTLTIILSRAWVWLQVCVRAI